VHRYAAPLPRWDPEADERLVVGSFPQLPAGWVDRDEADTLASEVSASGQPVVCVGGHGVGKSMLAAAYARHQASDTAGPWLIAWTNGATPLSLVSDLAALAHRLRVADPTNNERSADAARDVLNALPVPGLLVVDDAKDPDQIRRWLPAGTGRCRVIITSTDHRFAGFGTAVPVGTYQRVQSLTYLAERTGLQNDAGADCVAQAVADLPLGVALAAAVIRRDQLTYQDWLDRFATHPISRMMPAHLLRSYPGGLVDAVGLSVRTATSRSPNAAPLLTLFAVLDPAGITRALLHELTSGLEAPVTGLDLDDALAALSETSLITRTSDTIRMHGLVSRIIRETPGDLPAHAGRALNTLAQHAETIGHHLAGLPTDYVQQIGRHALSLLAHAHEYEDRNEASRSDAELVGSAANEVAVFLAGSGAYSEGVSIAEATADLARRRFGARHPNTLGCEHNLALAYLNAGRFQQGLDLITQVVFDRTSVVLGANDADTCSSRGAQANAYAMTGHPHEAMTIHQLNVAARTAAHGFDHPLTLISRHNVASLMCEVGLRREAIPLLQEILDVRIRELGVRDPDTLQTSNNLATAYFQEGLCEDAASMHQLTATIREQVLGVHHLETLISHAGLALAQACLGDVLGATSRLEYAHTHLRAVLGNEHPITRKVADTLAHFRTFTED